MSIEGASYRFEVAARQCAFVGTAGEGLPSLGTADWLFLQRVELLSGGTRLFEFTTNGNNYLAAYLVGSDIRFEWRAIANTATCTISAQRFGTSFYLAGWRDGSTLRAGLIGDDGIFDTASAALTDSHNLTTLAGGAIAYFGRTSGGTFSANHFGHISMWSGVTGSALTALSNDQWAQIQQRPNHVADVASGATLAMSWSRLTDSSGVPLEPAGRSAMPAGTLLQDTVSGNTMALAIGSPSGNSGCFQMPNYTQPARTPDVQDHQFVQPSIAKIAGNFYRASTHANPANARNPLLYPLNEQWQKNDWPVEILPRYRFADSSDSGTVKTFVGNTGITLSTDYHYTSAVEKGTGNQAIYIYAMHSNARSNQPESGDTLYDAFGVYRVDLSTGLTTWEAIPLGGTAATDVFTYGVMYTPPGADYTLAFVRNRDEANARGYAVQINHTSGASTKQLTEPGTTIKGFYPREILDLGGGCYGFTYLDRLPTGGPSGYRMLVWDSAGVITDSSNWYETSGGTSPTLPLDVDDPTGLLHTINSGEATADRDSYIGQSIADGRGNMVLCLVRYEGELDDGWPSTPDAVEIRRLRGFSPSTHTFGSTDTTDITSIITALKSTEPFDTQPVIRWSNQAKQSAYLFMSLLDGETFVENTDFDQFAGEFGSQIVGWAGLPLTNPASWTTLSDNPLADTATVGGLCLRPMPGIGPNDDTDRRLNYETVYALNGAGTGIINQGVSVGLPLASPSSTLRRGVGTGFGRAIKSAI